MNKSTTRSGALLAALLLAGAAGANDLDAADLDSQAVVHWHDRSFEPGDWPQGLPPRVRAEVMRWAPLARELGYRLDLSDEGRVLMLSSARFNRSVRREDRLVKRGLAAFDELVAPTEDGAIAGGPVEECAVLLRCHDRKEYEAALDFLTCSRPYLSPWAASARNGDGFTLRQPNCAAWIEREAKRRAENELVHSLAQCLTAARYGEPPAWLTRGVAWHVELEVCRSIRTLPDAEEDRGWSGMLKDAYARREGLRLDCADFARLSAYSSNELQAGMAWGLVSYLAEYRPGAVGPVLSDLGRYAADHGRVELEDGRWEPKPGYEVPLTVQAQVLHRHVEGDLFAECTEYFQLGSRYRLPAAR